MSRSKLMDNYLFMLLAFMFLIVMSGLFAGSETGMYQLSRLRLRLGVEKKWLSYVMLGRCLQDGPGLLLAILVGNNLVNYLATGIVTGFFLGRVATANAAEFLATAVTVPVLFVFGELIPKNLFFFRADTLMPYVAPVLYAFHKILIFSGAVPLLRLISGFVARLTGVAASSKSAITSAQRHKVRALLRDTHEEGILSSVQSDILNRLVKISHVRIRSVMIPIDDAETVNADADRSTLLNKVRRCAFTRLPVTEDDPAKVIGFVSVYEALSSSKEFANLHDFIKPIRTLDADTTVTDAIDIMQKEDPKIVLITTTSRAGRERHIGIVTMKDLVEELLGELAEW